MPPTGNLGQLKTAQWDKLQDLADRFEAAWRQAGPADLDAFLPPPGDPLRLVVLHELIKLDLEMRWQRNQGLRLEQYLEKYPELGTARQLPARMVFEEYRARHKIDASLKPESYRDRFPAQYPELERLIAAEATQTPTEAPSAGPALTPAVGMSSGNLVSLGGGYKFVKKIGSGGFGEVWLAEAPGGIEVAIKVLFRSIDHDEAKRELQSLELIKRLRHPFLLQTHSYAPLQDRLYIIMELADGSLRDRLRECRQAGQHGIPAVELAGYVREAAEALDFLHGKKVLHRDIKPENILLLQRHAKVADFGLARLYQAQQLASVTGAGTPAYMAPEMWGAKVSEHSDQYCLAVSYAELRLDRRLFAGTNPLELMMEHLTRSPDLGDLPEAEKGVLRRALAKAPEERFPSCVAFAEALGQAVGLRTTPSSAGTAAPPRPAAAGVETAADATLTFPEGGAAGDKPRTAGPDWRRRSAAADGRPARGKRLLVGALLLALVVGVPVGLVASGVFGTVGTKGSSFTLEKPAALSVPAGWNKPWPLFIRRDNFREPVRLTVTGAPALVKIPGAVTIPADGVQTEVPVEVDDNAAPGRYTLTLRADSGGKHQTASLALTIEPPRVHWRKEWQRPAGARVVRVGSERYYDQIDVVRDGRRVRFLLAPRKQSNDPPSFYVMRDKVSYGLFRRFAADRPREVEGSAWKKPEWAGQGGPRDAQPVMGVTVVDAYRCARWLGGNLPTRRQWDRAAGRFEPHRGEGPFRGPWDRKDPNQVAVSRAGKGPMDAGQATRDVSPLGCHDMAGNGREWTRDLALDKGTVDRLLNKPDDPLLLVLLRGQSFEQDEPLRFRDLDRAEEPGATPDVKTWKGTERDLGFRVVIEPFE